MATVKELLKLKPKAENYAVDVADTVLKALQLMAQENIGAVLVTEGGKVVGIFSERDYARKGELQGHRAAETAVREVMTSPILTVNLQTSTDECLALMEKHHIRHLPVVEGERLVGLISIRDVMKSIIREREIALVGLENYILGSGFQM